MIRIVAFASAISWGFLSILGFTPLGVAILDLQKQVPGLHFVLSVLWIIAIISAFVIWPVMLYDWGVRSFEPKSKKLLWFAVLFCTMWLGATLYYFVVARHEKA